jgi:hypothetical protein
VDLIAQNSCPRSPSHFSKKNRLSGGPEGGQRPGRPFVFIQRLGWPTLVNFFHYFGSNVFVSPHFSEYPTLVNFCVGTERFTKVGCTVIRCSSCPVPNGYSPVPNGYSPVPNGYSPVPNGYSPVPNGYSPVPNGYSSVPNGYSSAPYGYSPVPNGYSPVPNGYSPVPNGYSPVPNGYSPVPNGYSPAFGPLSHQRSPP